MSAQVPPRILIVDDDQSIRRLLCRTLERAGYCCKVARTSSEAKELISGGNFEILLADLNMPGQSGLELVDYVVAEHHRTAPLVVTGVDDPAIAGTALSSGSYGYVIKPFTANEILIAVAGALRRRELEIENRAHRETLQELVRVRTAALERSTETLRLSREDTIRRLSRALEYRDNHTAGHTERMGAYAAVLARWADLDPGSMELACPMHDVGKVGVADSILLKPGPLTADERAKMERHTEIGHQILSGSGGELLELGATIALTHHERFDGTGYPRGLRGNEIPLEGQIAAIADVFDALTSERPYRPAFSMDAALEMMRGGRGTHFNPALLDGFFELLDELRGVRELQRAQA